MVAGRRAAVAAAAMLAIGLAACGATGADVERPVVTRTWVVEHTEAWDTVQRLIAEGLVPVHERAGALFLADASDRADTRHCVGYLADGTEHTLCARLGTGEPGGGFRVHCFDRAVVGQPLPAACSAATAGA